MKELLAVYVLQKLLGKERTGRIAAALRWYAPRAAAAIFAFVAFAHTLRIVRGVDVSVAGWPVPLWVSVVAAIVAGYLSVALWNLNQRNS